MKRISKRDGIVTTLPLGFFDDAANEAVNASEVAPERKRMKQEEGRKGVEEMKLQNIAVDSFLKELEEEEEEEEEERGGRGGGGGIEKSNNDEEEELAPRQLGDEQVDIEAILYRARLESLKELRREGMRLDDSDELQEAKATGGANQLSREEQESLFSESIKKKVINEKKKKAGVDDNNVDDGDDNDFGLQWQRKGIKGKR